jgi:hypothetical protein
MKNPRLDEESWLAIIRQYILSCSPELKLEIYEQWMSMWDCVCGSNCSECSFSVAANRCAVAEKHYGIITDSEFHLKCIEFIADMETKPKGGVR